jgi:hypothetical protein
MASKANQIARTFGLRFNGAWPSPAAESISMRASVESSNVAYWHFSDMP